MNISDRLFELATFYQGEVHKCIRFSRLLRSNSNLFLREKLGKKSGDWVNEREGNYSWVLECGGNHSYGATLQITGHTLALGLGTFGEGG